MLNRRMLIACAMAAPLAVPARAEPALLCVGGDHLPPLSEKRADGTIWGLRVDVVNLIAEIAQIPVRHEVFPWARCQSMVQQSEADLLCCAPIEQRQKYALFSAKPIIPSTVHAFYLRNSPDAKALSKVTSAADLVGRNAVTYLGNETAQVAFNNKGLRFLPTAELSMRAVLAGRADVWIESPIFGNWLLRREKLASEFASVQLAIRGSYDFHLGLRRDYPDAQSLMNKFNLAIKTAISSGRLKQALSMYEA